MEVKRCKQCFDIKICYSVQFRSKFHVLVLNDIDHYCPLAQITTGTTEEDQGGDRQFLPSVSSSS